LGRLPPSLPGPQAARLLTGWASPGAGPPPAGAALGPSGSQLLWAASGFGRLRPSLVQLRPPGGARGQRRPAPIRPRSPPPVGTSCTMHACMAGRLQLLTYRCWPASILPDAQASFNQRQDTGQASRCSATYNDKTRRQAIVLPYQLTIDSR
jgi:hypothetical protein